MNVFTFSVYGSDPKYCQGVVENLEEIQKRFPDFKVYLYVSTDVPYTYIAEYKKFPCAVIETIPYSGHVMLFWRYFAIDLDSVAAMFPRDADSRINDRDEWCVRQFLQSSDKHLHMIRDHFWHKTLITGGMWGIKKTLGLPHKMMKLFEDWHAKVGGRPLAYGDDQTFLSEFLYPSIPEKVKLIHSNIIGHERETVTPIPDHLFSDTDFIGNVWEYNDKGEKTPKFRFNDYPMGKHLVWLQQRDQFQMVCNLSKNLDVRSIQPSDDRNVVLDAVFVSNFYCGYYDQARETLGMFESTHVQMHNVVNSNFLISKLQKKIVGTCDPTREPADDEIVVCYGKYPLDHRALPSGNKVYRHAMFATMLKHTRFESHPCWDSVDVIYVLNLKERKDRLTDVMTELSSVHAPLDRVHVYEAEKTKVTGNDKVDAYLGATNNHLDVVAHFETTKARHALVLEDDFIFNSNVGEVQSAIRTFFERAYVYDVCLLATSKYGEIVPHDDLLNRSYQPCTTTSAYFVCRDTFQPVLQCFREGVTLMRETMDFHKYVCDRYWAKLQKNDRFFVLKSKVGYQRIGFSSILNKTNALTFD
jgi:hypothetical protein